MDDNDSQTAQILPIDVIQLLQCIQSGAPIAFEKRIIEMLLLWFLEGTQRTKKMKLASFITHLL